MTHVHERPQGANAADPLDPTNHDAFKRWLADVRVQAEDAISAGIDATARKKERVLSRAEARRKLLEARRNLRALLAAAGVDGG